MIFRTLTRGLSRRLHTSVASVAAKPGQKRLASTNATSKIRNIGIIAHIDAGKTTTTERILYLSGTIKHLGNVDEGDTTMDFLPAERERGITIASAATSFNWAGHTVNLIDTPGHADFTFEVIRSIRVLDGAVCVLDGVAGVEAQTEKVWKQASEMGIPKIAFVNKMDRAGAGFGRTVKEIVSKLRTRVALLTVPVFSKDSDRNFEGVVDVLNGCVITWVPGGDGKNSVVVPVSEATAEIQEEYRLARTALVETLTELDEGLVELFLETEDYMAITTEDIKASLRRATVSNEIVPVLCGASFRNIGVQPLMDAVVDFLPSPGERPPTDAIIAKTTSGSGKKAKSIPARAIKLDDSMKNLTCALAFKVVQDPIKGPLVYVRVYKGELKQNSTLFNTTTGAKDRVSRLLKVHADTTSEVASITEGNIGVILGSNSLATGDTVVCHSVKKDAVMKLPAENRLLQLKQITVPPPVFFVRIDPASVGDTRPMNDALALLLREDPSLNVSRDEETNQTTLSGMGELHLEIAQNRLIEDFKAKIVIGPIIISYKETLNGPSKTITKSIETEAGAVSTVKLRVEPIEESTEEDLIIDHENNALTFPYALYDADLEPVAETNQRFSFERADKEFTPGMMEEAFRVGSVPPLASCGPVCRLPLKNVRVVVESWHIPQHVSSTNGLKTATRLAVMEALATSDATLMEPIMHVYVSVNEADIGGVVKDLSGSRNGQIVSIMDPTQLMEEQGDTSSAEFVTLAQNTYVPEDYTMYLSKHEDEGRTQQSIVHARVPLREMVGYLKTLRSMTQGRANFTMEVDEYEAVTPDKIQPIVDSIFA